MTPARWMAAALVFTAVPAFAAVRHHRSAHSLHPVVRHETPGMSSERATEIQTALIHQGYLTGQPSGTWDAASVAAMQKLQADNGWQTKVTPDARALNKLGLGAQPVAVAPSPTAAPASTRPPAS